YKFMTEAQALLHGDLHSGSIMVTDTDTKVIDPEFGFMGPMAFDIGNYIGNLLLAYFSRPGWDANEQRRADYQEWLL
ncbi:phosphotransferase, partial [Escherichia coli]